MSSSKIDIKIKDIDIWLQQVAKIQDPELIKKFIDRFCKEENFKLPLSLRNSGKLKPKKLQRLKYNFVSKNWNKFTTFIAIYLMLSSKKNETDHINLKSNVDSQTDSNSLVDSLITI